jgi:hypothetical protein
MVVNMEITDAQAESLRPKLGTTIRVHGLESGVKYDGKEGRVAGAGSDQRPCDFCFEGGVLCEVCEDPDWNGCVGSHLDATWVRERLNSPLLATLADGGTVQSRMLPTVIVSGLATRPVNARYAGAVMDTGSLRTAAATGAVTFVTTSAGFAGKLLDARSFSTERASVWLDVLVRRALEVRR